MFVGDNTDEPFVVHLDLLTATSDFFKKALAGKRSSHRASSAAISSDEYQDYAILWRFIGYLEALYLFHPSDDMARAILNNYYGSRGITQ